MNGDATNPYVVTDDVLKNPLVAIVNPVVMPGQFEGDTVGFSVSSPVVVNGEGDTALEVVFYPGSTIDYTLRLTKFGVEIQTAQQTLTVPQTITSENLVLTHNFKVYVFLNLDAEVKCQNDAFQKLTNFYQIDACTQNINVNKYGL